MKTNKHFFAAAALMALTACSSDDIQMEPAEERIPVRLAYTTIDATETRAAQNLHEGMFDPGDSLVVRISNTGADSWTDYTFIIGEDGALIPKNTTPYFPIGDQNIDIAAFYPTKKGGGGVPQYQRGLMASLMAGQMSGNLYVHPDQTTDANYKASDLMYAFITNQAIQSEPVKLVFKHAMAKICVNVTAGDGVGSITSVSIPNVKYIGYACPATGECGVREGYSGAIAMSNNGAAVIPAQTINGAFLIIETDKGKVVYEVDNKTFEAGHVYTLNITVNLNAIGGIIHIDGWTDDEPMTVSPKAMMNVPTGLEAVDLGLSVLWANMNVGAKSENERGTLFAWGETSGKTYYGWGNYAWCMGSFDTLTKYCYNWKRPEDPNTKYDYWFDWTGTEAVPDNKMELDPGDDAAHVNWGGKWRMPTYTEIHELLNECERRGDWFYSKDGNNKRIHFSGTWCSSTWLFSYEAYVLNEENGYYAVRAGNRCDGFPVRPVMPKE